MMICSIGEQIMNDSLYNTDVEIGLRCLFILKELNPISCSLERLLYLDYLSLYIEEINSEAANLHPQYPLQSIEIIEKQQLLKKSILKFAYKGLVDVVNDVDLSFQCNANTLWLLADIENEYSSHLTKNIKLAIQATLQKTDSEVKNMILSKAADSINKFNGFYPFTEED